jgi:hypothetical protein
LKSIFAALALAGLIAAMAAVVNIPGPVLKADQNRDERREKVSYAAAHGRTVGGWAAQAAPAAIAPDPTLTPGAVRTIDVGEICSHGTRELRHWDRERDDRIMAEYGLRPGPHPDFELDHLIPLGIGGADSDANLWPEPRRSIEPQWNAETKDRLEWKLHDLICSGQLDVREAQRMMAEDWVEAYGRFTRRRDRRFDDS